MRQMTITEIVIAFREYLFWCCFGGANIGFCISGIATGDYWFALWHGIGAVASRVMAEPAERTGRARIFNNTEE